MCCCMRPCSCNRHVSTGLKTVNVQGLSSVKADLVWGVLGSDNSENAFGDPIAAIQRVPIDFDETFDLRTKESQQLVFAHLADLIDPETGDPRPNRANLTNGVNENPLQDLRVFCNPDLADNSDQSLLGEPDSGSGTSESFAFSCQNIDSETNLPMGDSFAEALFAYQRTGPGVVRPLPV